MTTVVEQSRADEPAPVVTDLAPVAVAELEAAPGKDEPPAPTKVRIDTPGVTIEIEANESLETVAAAALRLFHDAGGWPQDHRGSTGFGLTEKREVPPVQPSSMYAAPGPYPTQTP